MMCCLRKVVFAAVLAGSTLAALSTGGGVRVSWHSSEDRAILEIADEGPGISNMDNLFVPFFTTKAGGTGIGLVLCRQIAEAHRGSLGLENRRDRSGCLATLQLPISGGDT